MKDPWSQITIAGVVGVFLQIAGAVVYNIADNSDSLYEETSGGGIGFALALGGLGSVLFLFALIAGAVAVGIKAARTA